MLWVTYMQVSVSRCSYNHDMQKFTVTIFVISLEFPGIICDLSRTHTYLSHPKFSKSWTPMKFWYQSLSRVMDNLYNGPAVVDSKNVVISEIILWWLSFEKKPFQFWQDIWILVLVILLALYQNKDLLLQLKKF